MNENIQDRETKVCNECKSEYYTDSSKVRDICPECSHVLYGYENCAHQFVNGRCLKCFWNGNASEYIKKLEGQ